MAEIQSSLKVEDGAVKVSIEFRLFKGGDGKGLIMLDPQDQPSREFLDREGRTVSKILAAKYGVKEPVVYERDGDGYYVPQPGTKGYGDGSPHYPFQLVAIGIGIDETDRNMTQHREGPCR